MPKKAKVMSDEARGKNLELKINNTINNKNSTMMKNILGLVLVTVLLWSCGSQFSRSKYDRHMWNRSHGHTEKTVNANSDEESKTNTGKVVEEKKATLSMIDQQETGNIEVKSSSLEEKNVAEVNASTKLSDKKVQTSKEKKSDVAFTKKNSTQNNFLKKFSPLAVKKSKNNPMQDGDVDAMWIVTLILCFLVPPLGVYLKDGSLTGLFWLVLIFCLLGGGLGFGIGGAYAGLYGVGIILALLRFFDII
jgi:uncharacterized membrane protein YqaE (UPF0057 family)